MRPHPLDDTYALFRQTCARFAETHIAPNVVEWEEAERFPRDLYREAAEAGTQAGTKGAPKPSRDVRTSSARDPKKAPTKTYPGKTSEAPSAPTGAFGAALLDAMKRK